MSRSILTKFLTQFGNVVGLEKSNVSLHCYADFSTASAVKKILDKQELLFSTNHLKRSLIPSIKSDCPCLYCKPLVGSTNRYYDAFPDEYPQQTDNKNFADFKISSEAIAKYKKKSYTLQELQKFCTCSECSNWGALSTTTDQKCRTCGQSDCKNKVYWKCSKHENI